MKNNKNISDIIIDIRKLEDITDAEAEDALEDVVRCLVAALSPTRFEVTAAGTSAACCIAGADKLECCTVY